MSNRAIEIINEITAIVERSKHFELNVSPYYLSRDDHNYLANHLEGKIFQGSYRPSYEHDVKSYLGVDLLIIEDKKEMTDMHEIFCQRFRNLEKQQEHDKERITYVNQLVIDLEKKINEKLNNLGESTCESINKLLIRFNELQPMPAKYQFNNLIERLDVQTETITASLERIEKLERKSILPTEKRLTEILREQLPNHDVEITFDPGMKDETAYMAIRCPRKTKYMSFKEAIEQYFNGRKISRRDWQEQNHDWYVFLNDGESVSIDRCDMVANDWYIVE